MKKRKEKKEKQIDLVREVRSKEVDIYVVSVRSL